MKEMNKSKMKHNALEALMLVVFVLSVAFVEVNTMASFVGLGISAASLALLN
jgi:hypothetical protein